MDGAVGQVEAAGRTNISFVPAGLKRCENVKTSPRGPLAQIRLRQPNAQRSGWPLAGQRDKHSQVGQLFQGELEDCSWVLPSLDRIFALFCRNGNQSEIGRASCRERV